jgi:hypothetical protein
VKTSGFYEELGETVDYILHTSPRFVQAQDVENKNWSQGIRIFLAT